MVSHRSGETEDTFIGTKLLTRSLSLSLLLHSRARCTDEQLVLLQPIWWLACVRARSRPALLAARSVWPSTTSCCVSRRSSARRFALLEPRSVLRNRGGLTPYVRAWCYTLAATPSLFLSIVHLKYNNNYNLKLGFTTTGRIVVQYLGISLSLSRSLTKLACVRLLLRLHVRGVTITRPTVAGSRSAVKA